jgi:hypothetical protein
MSGILDDWVISMRIIPEAAQAVGAADRRTILNAMESRFLSTSSGFCEVTPPAERDEVLSPYRSGQKPPTAARTLSVSVEENRLYSHRTD